MSKSITSMKVVEDYSSNDDEKEAAVRKMKSNSLVSHRKIQGRHKKDKIIEQRDKRSPQQRWNRAEENSSDENINRRHDKRSRKHKVVVDSKDSTSHNRKETQPERYQDNDSSDYDRRHCNREAEKHKEKIISDDDKRYERKHIQRTERRYDHNSDIDRREVEGNNDWQNDDNDRIDGRRQQEKGRYWDDDSSNHHKRDRSSKHIENSSNMKNNWRDDKTESLRGSYQNESDHERSKRKKSRHQQDDDDYHNRRDSRHQAQNEDDSDFERSHIEETGYQSDCDDSDYDKGDGRKADRNRLDDERNYSDREKHRHKDKTWFSDDERNDRGKRRNKKDGEKSKHHQSKENESISDGRKDERSTRKNKSHHDDSNYKSNEKRQPEKTKHKQKNYHSEDITDCNKKEMQKDKHYLVESDQDRREIPKRGNKDDWDKRSHDRQKDISKIRQQREDKNDNWSDDKNDSWSDRASDSFEPQQDRCRWDSNEDDRDKRKLQQKYRQNSGNEDDKRENIGRHSVTDKLYQKRKNNRDLREKEENRNVQRKDSHKEKERSSEMQSREDLSRRKDDRYREHGRREKQIEPELQRTEGSERLRSEVQKRSRRNEEPESNLGDARHANEEGAAKKQKSLDDILTRTGGAYIPPARLRAMQAQITDKSSVNYQRIAWEALKKSINGLINKVNVSNLKIIVNELFKENIVRAKGILARSIMQAQAASPTFTHVYAALVAIINTKFPHIGELIIKRLIIQFRRSFRRNDKQVCFACTNFIAHLVNQQAAHEVLALEILTLLLENPTDDSVELAVGFLKESGLRLSDATRRGTDAIFERLRSILHDGEVDKRVQYMIEVMFAVRKDKFKDHPTVIEELDLVEEEDQFTHLITLEDAIDPEDILNVFKYDAEFEANEAKYEEIRKALLESSDSEDNSGDESNDNEEDEENENETQTIIDNTETNLTSLRRTIYLTIQSSLDFEECAHKLLKLELKPGQIVELCYMILDCCAQQRTYEKFFGLLAQRFCQLNKIYVEPFEDIFKTAYDTIHRFETNKLRNVARFFAHLFYTDAISWQILSHIKLNEDDTTSSSRIFIKILFQELCEYMGLLKLNQRVKDPTMQEAFEGLFPRDSPRNTRFAINFFTSIGLGGLTDELREHLKNAPKPAAFTSVVPSAEKDDNDENPDINNEEASSIVEISPSSESSSEEEEPRNEKSRQPKKKRKKKSKDKKSKKRRKK